MSATARPGDLVGTKEAAELFGVRPQNFLRDWASRADFPKPLATLAATRVWSRNELDDYRSKHVGPVRWPRRGRLRLSPEAERWLPVVKRRVVERFQPERIIVFGSQARGKPGPDSDLDLLVVLPDGAELRRSVLAIREALADVGVAKDIFVTTPAAAARFGTVVGTLVEAALHDGVTVYERGSSRSAADGGEAPRRTSRSPGWPSPSATALTRGCQRSAYRKPRKRPSRQRS